MGGRLDATNVIREPIMSVITGISLDHTAFLGDSVPAIAKEKAGIIKDGAPVLYGGADEDAAAVIEAVAKEKGSEFLRTPRRELTIDKTEFTGTDLTLSGRKYRIGLLGTYQPYNAANVITAVDVLRRRGLNISDEALINGLAEAKWKGRFELLSSDPVFISDGSHNPEGIAAAVDCVKTLFGEKVILLSGVMKDKDYPDMARELSEIACYAVTLKPDNPRALDAELYAEEFRRNGVKAEGYGTVDEAVKRVVDLSQSLKKPVVSLGSLYMYGEVKAALFNQLN